MTEAFFKTIAGSWRGEEKMWADQGAAEPMRAEAKFENKPLIGGEAIGAEYVQTVNGDVSLECFTLIRRTDEADGVEFILAAKGQPRRVFTGRVNDLVVTAEGMQNGVTTRFTQDYSTPGEVKTTSMAVAPDGSEQKVFEAHYYRQPATGMIGWRDLTVEDAEGVRDFYTEVVGWTAAPVSMGDYSDFTMVTGAGEGIAGVCHARGENADLPPQWLMYVTVADLDKSIAAAKRLGGEIVAGPRGLAGGKFAVMRDPAGAVIAVWEE